MLDKSKGSKSDRKQSIYSKINKKILKKTIKFIKIHYFYIKINQSNAINQINSVMLNTSLFNINSTIINVEIYHITVELELIIQLIIIDVSTHSLSCIQQKSLAQRALCSVGKTHFHLPLIKSFPFLVRSITRAENNDLMPIQLQGIVQFTSKEDQKSMKMAEHNHSTSLNILLEYYLPLNNSDPTSLNKCFTFKVALGSGIAINTILGLPFLKQSKCMIDLNEGVIQSKSFSDPPFKIEYQLPDSSPPPDFEAIKKASTQSTSKVDINLVKEINSLHNAFIASSNIIPSTEESTNHSTYNPL